MSTAKQFGKLLQKWGKALAGAKRSGAAPSRGTPPAKAFAGNAAPTAAQPAGQAPAASPVVGQAAVPSPPGPPPSAIPVPEPALSRFGKMAVKWGDIDRDFRAAGGDSRLVSGVAGFAHIGALLAGDDVKGWRRWKRQRDAAPTAQLAPPVAAVPQPAAVVAQGGGQPPSPPASAMNLPTGPINVGATFAGAPAAPPASPPVVSGPATAIPPPAATPAAPVPFFASPTPATFAGPSRPPVVAPAAPAPAVPPTPPTTVAAPASPSVAPPLVPPRLTTLINQLIGSPGAKKFGFTQQTLRAMPESFVRDMAAKIGTPSGSPQAGTFAPQLNPAGIPPSASPPLLTAPESRTPFPQAVSSVLGGAGAALSAVGAGAGGGAGASSLGAGDRELRLVIQKLTDAVEKLTRVMEENRKADDGDADQSESAENREGLWRRMEPGEGPLASTAGGSSFAASVPGIFRTHQSMPE